uniref:N protein n=1 Tax=Solanum tuberosum TaxID=4113 RepID=M1C8N3_SOLTU
MVELDTTFTLISQPPSSIVRLNKLNILNFQKQKSEVGLNDGVFFVFPQVNEGLHSLEYLDLSYCNLIDGGLPKDIGCLSSLKELYLSGNNFEHLPRSIAQLGALQSLDVSDCKRLTHLPELPPKLDTIGAMIQSVIRCFRISHHCSITSLLQIPCHYECLPPRGRISQVGSTIEELVEAYQSVCLKIGMYVRDSFLGFAVCYSGSLIDTKAYLIPSCNRMSCMTQKLSASSYSKCVLEPMIHFFLVPLAGLWDTYKANGKTPNDYGIISLFFEEMKEFGFRLLYKDEPGLVALNRYDNSERHDFVTNEASCSSSETLQLFPTSPGF